MALLICPVICHHVIRCKRHAKTTSFKPGPHRTRQRCSGPVCHRPSASLEVVLTGKNGPRRARTVGNGAGTVLTGVVRTGNGAGTVLTGAVRTGLQSSVRWPSLSNRVLAARRSLHSCVLFPSCLLSFLGAIRYSVDFIIHQQTPLDQ